MTTKGPTRTWTCRCGDEHLSTKTQCWECGSSIMFDERVRAAVTDGLAADLAKEEPMDPVACLTSIEEGFFSVDYDRMAAAIEELTRWLANDGFVPEITNTQLRILLLLAGRDACARLGGLRDRGSFEDFLRTASHKLDTARD